MTVVSARVPTPNARKYMLQLSKHWGHRLDVTQSDDGARIGFGHAVCELTALPDALVVELSAAPADLERMQTVVADHVNRFAFREGPLPFEWIRADGATEAPTPA